MNPVNVAETLSKKDMGLLEKNYGIAKVEVQAKTWLIKRLHSEG